MMKKISLDKLNALYAAIAAETPLYAPVKSAGKVNFSLWNDGAEVSLDTLKTVKSAKDVFFPQSEDLVEFKRDGKKIDVAPAEGCTGKFVVFGVRGCDARSFSVLDAVFLADPVDTYYKSRRDNGVIVTLACGEPEESCFCKNFGINASDPEGDVTTWIISDTLYWRSNTENGEELTNSLKTLLTDADEKAVDDEKNEISKKIDALPFSELNLSAFGGDATDKLFDSPEWQKLSAGCLGCGTCTFVCPTCQCYDIRDYDTGHGIKRFRCWDSCMRSDFTLMSAGNPRPAGFQRFRQRFMHKLVYYPANNGGVYSCVGCGRCVEKCPSSLNIVKVIKAFGEEK